MDEYKQGDRLILELDGCVEQPVDGLWARFGYLGCMMGWIVRAEMEGCCGATLKKEMVAPSSATNRGKLMSEENPPCHQEILLALF